MQNIIHIIRSELSGMFTKNIVDEVVRRIENAIERSGNREKWKEAYGQTEKTYDTVAS